MTKSNPDMLPPERISRHGIPVVLGGQGDFPPQTIPVTVYTPEGIGPSAGDAGMRVSQIWFGGFADYPGRRPSLAARSVMSIFQEGAYVALPYAAAARLPSRAGPINQRLITFTESASALIATLTANDTEQKITVGGDSRGAAGAIFCAGFLSEQSRLARLILSQPAFLSNQECPSQSLNAAAWQILKGLGRSALGVPLNDPGVRQAGSKILRELWVTPKPEIWRGLRLAADPKVQRWLIQTLRSMDGVPVDLFVGREDKLFPASAVYSALPEDLRRAIVIHEVPGTPHASPATRLWRATIGQAIRRLLAQPENV